MNKDIKRLLVIFIALILISTTIILIKGREYTIRYDVTGNDYNVQVEKDGIVEVLDTK